MAWVTKEEISNAKRYDLLTFLQHTNPYDLVKKSANEYGLKSHGSLKISNGLWNWHSHGIGGRTALDYLIKVKGYKFTDAVIEINRRMGNEHCQNNVNNTASPPNCEGISDEKVLRLPERNENNDEMIRYLTARGLDRIIIDSLIKSGTGYEEKVHHGIIFIGRDESGVPRHAAYRSTQGDNKRGDCRGSDKRYAFRLEKKDAATVRVFESAIDLLSYMNLRILWRKDFKNDSYISLAGITLPTADGNIRLPSALENYLSRNPQTKKIVLHLDSDDAGIRASQAIRKALNGRYDVEVSLPPAGKDYNDYLRIIRKESQ